MLNKRMLKACKQIDNYQYDNMSLFEQNTQYNWKSKGRKEENIYLKKYGYMIHYRQKGKEEVCVESDNETNRFQLLALWHHPQV